MPVNGRMDERDVYITQWNSVQPRERRPVCHLQLHGTHYAR